jgi:hypothetical protein
MHGTIAEAIKVFRACGIDMTIKPSDMRADVYIVTLPSGAKDEPCAPV